MKQSSHIDICKNEKSKTILKKVGNVQCETARSKKNFLFDILQYQLHEENLLFDADLIKKKLKNICRPQNLKQQSQKKSLRFDYVVLGSTAVITDFMSVMQKISS